MLFIRELPDSIVSAALTYEYFLLDPRYYFLCTRGTTRSAEGYQEISDSADDVRESKKQRSPSQSHLG